MTVTSLTSSPVQTSPNQTLTSATENLVAGISECRSLVSRINGVLHGPIDEPGMLKGSPSGILAKQNDLMSEVAALSNALMDILTNLGESN